MAHLKQATDTGREVDAISCAQQQAGYAQICSMCRDALRMPHHNWLHVMPSLLCPHLHALLWRQRCQLRVQHGLHVSEAEAHACTAHEKLVRP
jgi:hypothetical protein